MAMVEYKNDNVLTAARRRISQVFDEFEDIVVSVSGGKDSTVLRHLAIEEAARRGRKVKLFFLDQEAEYQSTIDVIRDWMHDPQITPEWYQVPTEMTNATSHKDYFLRSWEPGAQWLHEQDPIAITAIEGEYPKRFYEFFEWHEAQAKVKTAYLVGIRTRESFNRFRAVTKSAGYKDWAWSTSTKNKNAVRCYPIFDWIFGDVWKYIVDEGLTYNKHYDRMFAKRGVNVTTMRVSNLIHEKSFRCLVDLQEFEPDTYERLITRLGGVHAAALYADEDHVFNAKVLPEKFKSWLEYRDYLLATTPIDRSSRFTKRFEKQRGCEDVWREQCKQILLNDWENNLPVSRPKRNRALERLATLV